MTQILVNNCNECPFNYKEYNDWAINENTIEICRLSEFFNLEESIIDTYDKNQSCKYCETLEDELYDITKCKCKENNLKTPEWCPLKNGSLNVKWEK